ncbi:MAG: porin, partial [Planctomycetales bacterium]
EWFNDQSGSRVTSTVGGAGGNYYELTAGINFEPHPNVMIRPEVRFDWAAFHTPGAGTSFAYASGTNNQSNSQRVFAIDAILSY